MKTKWVTCPPMARVEAIRWETVEPTVDDTTEGTLITRSVDGKTKWSDVSYEQFKQLANTSPSAFDNELDAVLSETEHTVHFNVEATSGSLYGSKTVAEEDRELGPFERLLRGEDVPEEELPMDSLTSDEPAMDDEPDGTGQAKSNEEENVEDDDFDDLFEA